MKERILQNELLKIAKLLKSEVDLTDSKQIWKEGMELAEKLMDADKEWEYLRGKVIDLQMSNKKSEKKLIPEFENLSAKYKKEYNQVKLEADAFEGKNNISVIEAWESYTKRSWPYYKV